MQRLNYSWKLFLSCAVLFGLFTIGVSVFEQSREKEWRTKALVEKLDLYTDIIFAHFPETDSNTIFSYSEKDLEQMLPAKLRISLIKHNGDVFYDNSIEGRQIENHSDRPEILEAKSHHWGVGVRRSSSNNIEYIYYAKQFSFGYIRVALPYDIEARHFLQTDNLFLYYVGALFLLTLLLMNYVLGKFSTSIKQLRALAFSPESAQTKKYHFPKDELGDISEKIREQFSRLQEKEAIILHEKEKLLQHIHTSGEGICFFSKNKKVDFVNGLFMRYINLLTEEPDSDPNVVWNDPIFTPIQTFIKQKTVDYLDTEIEKHGRRFSLRANLFSDESCEIILNDITLPTKNKLLKQEMTGNIAHELRTPVTSIRGYLETIKEQELDEKDTKYFITRAYEQTIVLSDLIRDISLITQIEGTGNSFQMTTISLCEVVETIKNDFSLQLKQQNMVFQSILPECIEVWGNQNLLYALLRNLLENAIRYAGEGSSVVFKYLHKDETHLHFSFYDTGKGIENEAHFPRLFERFYRVNQGRSRDKGGSGLGLSIVKNAVHLHQSEISVRNRKEGGLEFLFSLPIKKSI